jgi:hypothetical protein
MAYRRLNRVIVLDSYPLLLINKLCKWVQSTQIFSTNWSKIRLLHDLYPGQLQVEVSYLKSVQILWILSNAIRDRQHASKVPKYDEQYTGESHW